MENINNPAGFKLDEEFVETPFITELITRCMGYLKAGIPLELRGAAGTGKTTLALIIAKKLERPIVLVYGNDEYSTGNLMGNFLGLRKRWVLDNYISSVEKKEESYKLQWQDGRLVSACRDGYTFIYDEFTRSKPETNNMLLSALSEGIIEIPNVKRSERYVRVHPDFRIIFTSNHEEYSGVYSEQDALKDRLLTIEINSMDIDTEIAIVRAKTGLSHADSEAVVRMVHNVVSNFKNINIVSVRKSIMLGKAVSTMNIPVTTKNPTFIAVCKDIVTSACLNSNIGLNEKREIQKSIDKYFEAYGKGGTK